MTKVLKGGGGVSTILMELLSFGQYRLAPESSEMSKRIEDPRRKARTREAVVQAEHEMAEEDHDPEN